MADTPYPVARDFRRTDILVGNGGTVYSGFGFKIFSTADVMVYLKRVDDLEYGEEPVVVAKDAALDYDDFSITFASAVTPADRYFVIGATEVERTAGVTKGTKIDPDKLEREFSRIAIMLNELRRDLNRAMVSDPSEAVAPVLSGDIADNQVLIRVGDRIVGGELLNVASETEGAAVITALVTKADLAYVDAQLAGKASMSALTTALASKQDSATAVRLTGAQTLRDKTLIDPDIVDPTGVVSTAAQILLSTEQDQARANIGANSLKAWPVVAAGSTEIVFSGIPATAKRVMIALSGLSSNGTQSLIAQLGTSAGMETTGASGGAIEAASGSAGSLSAAASNLFVASISTTAATLSGLITLLLVDPATNTWAFQAVVSNPVSQRAYSSSGVKSLSGTLTQLRLYAGGDTFDAGKARMFVDI